MSESIEEATARYNTAAHAMQTAVALKMERQIGKETEPKHLRVGINSAMVGQSGLVTLLLDKGVITREEYYTAQADAMEREVALYRNELGLPPNVTLR
jgi:hypothetical protein